MMIVVAYTFIIYTILYTNIIIIVVIALKHSYLSRDSVSST